jgi:hypothetical protein
LSVEAVTVIEVWAPLEKIPKMSLVRRLPLGIVAL